MLFRRLVALFALLACTVVSTPPPAAAQPAGFPKLGAPPKGGGDALQRWCRQAVFYRYGYTGQSPGMNLNTKGPLLFMNADTEFAKTQACVQTRGENF